MEETGAALEIEIAHAVVPAAGPVATAIGLLLAAAAIVAAAWAIGIVVARARRGLPAVDWRPHGPVEWGGREVAAAVLIHLAFQLLFQAVLADWTRPAKPGVLGQLAANAAAMTAATVVSIGYLLGCGVSRGSLGIGLGRLRDDAALAAGGLALIVAPLLAMAAGLDAIVPYRHPIIDFLAAHREWAAVLMAAVSVVIVAPVAEEFLFRRVLQGWLERRLDPFAAVGLSALAFALAHFGQGLAWVPLFFFGLVTGTLARQTGSIVPGIILHGLFNAVSLALVLTQGAAKP